MFGKAEVLEFLEEKGISYEMVEHPPVYTMEEMRDLGLHQKGELCKNLFLRDAKGKVHLLVVIREKKEANLKQLSDRLGIPKLSFASADRLMKYLGLEKGAVSPLGVLNDEGCQVQVVLDRGLAGKRKVGIHPNDNKATVFIDFEDLKGLVGGHGNRVDVISL